MSTKLFHRHLIAKLSAMVFLCVMASGCMQSSSNSNSSSSAGEEGSGGPEAYQYKGRIDQLTTKPVADRTAKLSERFKLIQARQ